MSAGCPGDAAKTGNLRGLFFGLLLGPGRAGILAFGFGFAIDQFDYGHRRVVTIAETRFDDAGITPGACLLYTSDAADE